MSKKGIKVMQTFENEGEAVSRVALIKTVQYENIDKSWKKQLWLKHKSVLGDGEFEDKLWKVPSEYCDIHYFLKWNELDKWQDHLKAFTLLLLDRKLAPASTAMRVNSLINFIKYTDYFSDECFVDFDDDPMRYCCSAETKFDIILFCDFIGFNPKKYIERIKELKFSYQVRDIPAFNSIYKFDKLIHDYRMSAEYDNPYIIIVLWWELTKVIPIRPIEFFTLRKDSFTVEEGRCYVHVKRAKLRDKEHEIPTLDKIGISNDVYELFDKYRTYNKAFLKNDSDFMFNVSIFNNYNRANYLQRDGYIGCKQMYELFYDFFEDIVDDKYGYSIIDKGTDIELGDNEIEYFQYGDSRHIAFINLLLSGFSPYTIAQIGGHTTIRQQMHYYDHLETYLASKAYTMATEARMSLKVFAGTFDIREKYALSKALTSINNDELQLMRKIEFGWCDSENFPYDCDFDDCLNCPHSIIDQEHQQMIPEKLKHYTDDIHKHVDFLKHVLSNPSLGTDSDRMTAINAINSDVATIAALYNKQRTEG